MLGGGPWDGEAGRSRGGAGRGKLGVEPTRLEFKVPQRPSSYVSEHCGETGRVQLQVEGLRRAQRFLYLS